jgi:CBS domain-containing protein/ribosome-associated translation inhibitor RaiA
MRLRDLMSTRVVTIESSETANAAWSRMRQHRIRHLVVTDNGDLVGVISERDLGGSGGEAIRRGRTVADLMNSRVVTASPTTTLREAANLMRGRLIGSLPVVENDRLVGIVTATDVLDALGRGTSRPTRPPEPRTLRMTESRRQARRPVVRQRKRAAGTGRARARKPDSPKRSPFVDTVPKELKPVREEVFPQPPAYIRSAEGELAQHDRDYIRRKLGMRLGKFSDSIERVSVRTEDVNGPRGGVDRMCRIKVVLRGLPSVVYESREATLNAAVDTAISGVERAVRRSVQRRRLKPLRRAA